MKLVIAVIMCWISLLSVIAQPAERRITREEYIEKYKEDAIREMMKSGVPASITLAQGILESGDGNSPLAIYGKNHFGVKCHTSWEGETMYLDDDEKNECFRKYETVYESYRDHSNFLTGRERYAFLFELKITDYKGWAKGLKKAGYATNPKYADILINLIEKNDLNKYDNYAKVPPRKLKKTRNAKKITTTKKVTSIRLHNNIKYVVAKKGDTFYRISKEYEIELWQIYRYNDLNKSDKLKVGDIIYLQPKRNKAKEAYHIVKKGESMRDISQLYGVKLKKIYKKNKMRLGTQPNENDRIELRRKIK